MNHDRVVPSADCVLCLASEAARKDPTEDEKPPTGGAS